MKNRHLATAFVLFALAQAGCLGLNHRRPEPPVPPPVQVIPAPPPAVVPGPANSPPLAIPSSQDHNRTR
jgi:hypothetical protein